MNPRRAFQIVLLVLMVVFVGARFAPLHVASCHTTIGKKDSQTLEFGKSGSIDESSPVAFEISGGDVAFKALLRDAFKDELAKRYPNAKLVDGPPPKNSQHLRLTLKSADERWTPFYSHEGLGIHTAIQLPGQSSTTQITADSDVDAVCTGIVAHSHFETHEDTALPMAGWLVQELADAKAPKG